MRNRNVTLAVFGFAVLGLASACKKGGAAKDDLQLVPKEAEVVIKLNLDKMRPSNMWKTMIDLRDTNEKSKKEYADFVTKCGFDPFNQISSITLAVPQVQDSGVKEFAAIARGQFNEAKLVACATDQAKTTGGELKTVEYNGKKIYSHSLKDDGQLVFLDDKTVALGGKEWIKKIVDLAKTDGDSAAKNDAIAGLTKKVKQTDGMWFAGLVPQNARDALKQNPAMAWTANMKAVYGSLDFTTGFAADVNVDNVAEADAKEMTSKLTDQLSMAKKLPQVAMIGLTGVLEGIKIDQKGATFHATMALTQAQVDDLTNRLKAMFKAMGSAFGGGGGGMGGPPPAPAPSAPPAATP